MTICDDHSLRMWGRILKTPKTKKHHQHDLVFYHSWWWMQRTPCLLPYQRQQWCCSRWWTMHTMHSFYAFRHLTHTVNRCHYSFLLNTWDLKRKTYVLSFYWQNLLFCNCPPPFPSTEPRVCVLIANYKPLHSFTFNSIYIFSNNTTSSTWHPDKLLSISPPSGICMILRHDVVEMRRIQRHERFCLVMRSPYSAEPMRL